MSVKSAKPGVYTLKCRKCAQQFRAQVQSDESIKTAIIAPKTTPRPQASTPAGDDTAKNPPRETPSGGDAPATARGAKTVITASTTQYDPNDSANASGASGEGTAVGDKSDPRFDATMDDVSGSGSVDLGAVTAEVPPGDKSGVAATQAVNPADLTRNDRTKLVSERNQELPDDVPARLGGYRIIRELGRGAMGAVYMARQLSLDRLVALKTIQSKWAKDPSLVARFTREAYAAAQLVHPNVVQIYDMGQDEGVNYFSMEFVQGKSLGEILREEGRLAGDVAVGYVLQAARGLRFAHERGMIHRDIKPDNIMLSDEGFAKVADLGLVKLSDMPEPEPSEVNHDETGLDSSSLRGPTNMTMANIAMGTPNYMAPEQADNYAGVDHRADIYSLGCTLYALLTGRPPFFGKTVVELITKHKNEPVVRPDLIVKDVPPKLSEVTLRMTAKRPGERYESMGELIADLEKYLDVDKVGGFSPTEDHVESIEKAVKEFCGSPTAKLRKLLITGFLGIFAAAFGIGLVFQSGLLAGLGMSFLLFGSLSYMVVSGFDSRSVIFSRIRQLWHSSSKGDMTSWGVGALLLVVCLWVAGQLLTWTFAGVVCVGLAFALKIVFDKRIEKEREGALKSLEEMAKNFRLRGLDEKTVAQFIVRYSGDAWEEIFENMFGYEAMIGQRDIVQESEANRRLPKFRSWRDPIVRWLDSRIAATQRKKEAAHLQKVEEEGLRHEGLSMEDARAMAEEMAKSMVEEVKRAAEQSQVVAMGDETLDTSPAVLRARRKAKLEEAREQAKARERTGAMFRRIGGLIEGLAGGRTRFVAGAALLACCLLWLNQNGFLNENISDAADSAIQQKDELKDIDLPGLPATIAKTLSGFNVGVAGVILLLSAAMRGWKIAFFIIPCAVICVLGEQLGVPDVGFGASNLSMAIGAALAAAGWMFGRGGGDDE